MTGLMLGLSLPALAAWLVLRRFTPDVPRLVLVCLSAVGGVSVSAVGHYVWVMGAWNAASYVWFDLAFWVIVILWLIATRNVPVSTRSAPHARRVTGVSAWCVTAFLLALLLTTGYFVLQSINEPHGTWDAWAIWNLKARFLFRGGGDWTDFFTPALSWSHQEYPPLLPAVVARLWRYAGTDLVLAPIIVAGLFFYGTIGVLVGAVAAVRGWLVASVAGVALLGAPGFVLHGASQAADVPLGFFILTAVVFIAPWPDGRRSGRRASIAGLAIGLASLTKDEGSLFALALIGISTLLWWRSDGGRRALTGRLGPMLTTAVPLIALAGLVRWMAPPSPYAVSGWDMLRTAVLDPARHGTILTAMSVDLWHWEGPDLVGLVPIMLCGVGVVGLTSDQDARRMAYGAVVTVAMMVASYYLAYVVSPYEVQQHIATSFNRILFQSWPTFVWALAMLVRAPSDWRPEHLTDT